MQPLSDHCADYSAVSVAANIFTIFLSLFSSIFSYMSVFQICVADSSHLDYAPTISAEMAESAKARGTGIAVRSADYIRTKMSEGKAIIAVHRDGRWAGFCYIETWSEANYVANSGLIISPEFRGAGLAKAIKKAIFKLSRKRYPKAKIFGLTTGLAVMKINSDLRYKPVTYSELTQDEAFWAGCKSCVNYDILMAKDRKMCLCTAMLFDPNKEVKSVKFGGLSLGKHSRLFERWMSFKKWVLLKAKKTSNPVDL